MKGALVIVSTGVGTRLTGPEAATLYTTELAKRDARRLAHDRSLRRRAEDRAQVLELLRESQGSLTMSELLTQSSLAADRCISAVGALIKLDRISVSGDRVSLTPKH